jgi:hypothetical protein
VGDFWLGATPNPSKGGELLAFQLIIEAYEFIGI